MFEPYFNEADRLKACIFIKKEIPKQVFSCEYNEIFKNSFLVEHFLYILLLCDDRILWTSLGTKLTCLHEKRTPESRFPLDCLLLFLKFLLLL